VAAFHRAGVKGSNGRRRRVGELKAAYCWEDEWRVAFEEYAIEFELEKR
jgi:hypothetical protein